MALQLESPAFHHNAEIPRRHTADGSNVSPPLTWSGIPGETASLALIVVDPDAPDPEAPGVPFVHWVVYNLPPDCAALPEGVTLDALPDAAGEGLNDAHQRGWTGPKPPLGRHRYYFRLYALSARLPDLGAATRADVERAMAGLTLAQTELVGTYERPE